MRLCRRCDDQQSAKPHNTEEFHTTFPRRTPFAIPSIHPSRCADPTGFQLRALQEHLRKHKQILYVFVDYMCLAQGKDRSNKDKAEFRATLPNINFLYLGCAVLVLIFDETCV